MAVDRVVHEKEAPTARLGEDSPCKFATLVVVSLAAHGWGGWVVVVAEVSARLCKMGYRGGTWGDEKEGASVEAAPTLRDSLRDGGEAE